MASENFQHFRFFDPLIFQKWENLVHKKFSILGSPVYACFEKSVILIKVSLYTGPQKSPKSPISIPHQCFFLYIYMYNFLFFVHMPEIFVHTRVRSCTKKSRNCFQNLAEIVFWYEICGKMSAARAKEDRKEQKTLILEIGTFFCTYDPENLKRIKKHCWNVHFRFACGGP